MNTTGLSLIVTTEGGAEALLSPDETVQETSHPQSDVFEVRE